MIKVYRKAKDQITYSNCKAPVRLVNPSMMVTISHGLNVSRSVLFAPPFEKPLCCSRRRAGSGVEPMYKQPGRLADRSR